jgi:hypothetical protein
MLRIKEIAADAEVPEVRVALVVPAAEFKFYLRAWAPALAAAAVLVAAAVVPVAVPADEEVPAPAAFRYL